MRSRVRFRSSARRPRMHSGFTIVELMVAIALGLLIAAGLTTIFVNNSNARSEIERGNQQIENGRYAMQLLTDDLRNAGYLAEFNPTRLATPAAKPDACATALADLATALPLAVQGYDNGANAPTCLSDVRTGTDILVVRRASTCAVGETDCDAVISGAPYFQASSCSSSTELASSNPTNWYALQTDIASLTLHQKDCNPPTAAGTLAPTRQYRTHIYFVANNDKAGDGIPTLKRAELGASGFNTVVPLVEGIENLQLEYGLDTATPTSGEPAVFNADPDGYLCTGAACVNNWRNTVAVKINLLARNTTQSAGYKDRSLSKSYVLGLKANGTLNSVGPFNDNYKRHAYESVVRLNNVAGRNAP
jgi:type IV pilus assembly protein PilW